MGLILVLGQFSSLDRPDREIDGEGGAGMVDEKITIQDASEVDPNLLRMLDRGLEDIEAGRTLPHDEAMAEVRRIREARRFARSNTGVAVNA